MKKEILFERLVALIVPERLRKSDAELKHHERCLKYQIEETIRQNLYIILGMPAIDKEYSDADVHSELALFCDIDNSQAVVTDATWRYVIHAMVRLNAYTKTKLLVSKRINEIYKLKKRAVRMLYQHAREYIVSEEMHMRADETLGENEYFMQYTIQNGDHISMIHQPWRQVKSLYPEEKIPYMLEQAKVYDNSAPVWEFERTDEERIKIEKMTAHLTLCLMVMEKYFGIDNYFVK